GTGGAAACGGSRAIILAIPADRSTGARRRRRYRGFAIRHPVANPQLHHLSFAGLVEFEGAVQGVGRFLIVIEHEVPTDSAHLHGILYAQTPAGNIDLVDTLIAEIAVAGIPEPVPVVMETILAELALGSGAGPEVVVDSFRHCRNRR